MNTQSYQEIKDLLKRLINSAMEIKGLDLEQKIWIKNHLLNYEFIRQVRLRAPEQSQDFPVFEILRFKEENLIHDQVHQILAKIENLSQVKSQLLDQLQKTSLFGEEVLKYSNQTND